MISGVAVTVMRPGAPAVDRLGNSVSGEPAEEAVSGVLVGEPTAADMEAWRANGVTLAHTLHFPKEYTASLRGCSVVLPEPWAGEYRVVGDPRPYMDANTPGKWNRPVHVEAADG